MELFDVYPLFDIAIDRGTIRDSSISTSMADML